MTELLLRIVAPCAVNNLGCLCLNFLRCSIITLLLFNFHLSDRHLLSSWVRSDIRVVAYYQKYLLRNILGSLTVQQDVTYVLFLCGNFEFFISFSQACGWQLDDVLDLAKFLNVFRFFCNFQSIELCVPNFNFVNFKSRLIILLSREQFQPILEIFFVTRGRNCDEKVLIDVMITVGLIFVGKNIVCKPGVRSGWHLVRGHDGFYWFFNSWGRSFWLLLNRLHRACHALASKQHFETSRLGLA